MAGLRSLARPGRAAIAGLLIASALALAGMTCTPADEAPPTTPVAAVGLEAMSGRAKTLDVTGPANRERFIALSVGENHNCAIQEDGRALCWGLDDHGQSSAPADERFVAISAGANHTCGLQEDGAALCWGHWGEWGREATSVLDEKFIAISAGQYHTCGLRHSGVAVCWGRKSFNDIDPRSPSSGNFIAIFSNRNHDTCGIRSDGSSLCWEVYSSNSPELTGPDGFASLSRSGQCGLKTSGEIFCPGLAGSEQNTVRGENLRYIGGSWDTEKYGFICGIRTSGSAICWSVSRHSDQDWNTPNIPYTQTFLDIGAGSEHACGLLADGSIKCWGSNRYGQASSSLARTVPPSGPPGDVLCNPGVVVVKGWSCRLPKSVETEVRRFAVTADGEGVVYGEGDEIYEIRHVSIDIGFHGKPVLVEDGWYRLESSYEDNPRCEGVGDAYDLFTGHQLRGFSDRPSGSSLFREIIRTCIILSATANANGDWTIDKTLVWEAHI